MKFKTKDWWIVIAGYIAIEGWWNDGIQLNMAICGYASIAFFYLSWICEILIEIRDKKL